MSGHDFEEMLNSILEGMSLSETKRHADRVISRLNMLDGAEEYRIEHKTPTGANPLRPTKAGGYRAFWMKKIDGVNWSLGKTRQNLLCVDGPFLKTTTYQKSLAPGDAVLIGRTNADGTKQLALCEYTTDDTDVFEFVDEFAHIIHVPLPYLRPIYRGVPDGASMPRLLTVMWSTKSTVLEDFTDEDEIVRKHPDLTPYRGRPNMLHLLVRLKEIGM